MSVVQREYPPESIVVSRAAVCFDHFAWVEHPIVVGDIEPDVEFWFADEASISRSNGLIVIVSTTSAAGWVRDHIDKLAGIVYIGHEPNLHPHDWYTADGTYLGENYTEAYDPKRLVQTDLSAYTRVTAFLPVSEPKPRIIIVQNASPKSHSMVSPKFRDWCARLPVTRAKLLSPAWLPDFSTYLRCLLEPIFSSGITHVASKEGILTALVESKSTQPYWIRAFTHISYNLSLNMESLETLGDAVITSAFMRFCFVKYPSASPGQLTEMLHTFMSKVAQSQISRQMRLADYCISDSIEPAESNVSEDLFESFFGALEMTSSLVAPELTSTFIYNYIAFIFEDVDLLGGIGASLVKTQVNQRANKMGWGHDIFAEEKMTLGSSFRVTIRLKNKVDRRKKLPHWEVLNELRHETFSSYANSIIAAEYEAYEKLNVWLNLRNITEETATKVSTERRLSTLGKPLQEAQYRAQSKGFESIDFLEPKSTNTSRSVVSILFGRRSDGQTVKLAVYRHVSFERGKDASKEARIGALNKYLSAETKSKAR